jgi:hypothetical protein
MRDNHILDSNGVLLYGDNYFYTYLQRFSGVEELTDRMRRQMSRDNWELRQYRQEPATVYGHYGRFDLLDLNLGGWTPPRPQTLQPTSGDGENQFNLS